MTLGLLTPAVQAEVVDAENHGFTVRQEVAIIAPPETVWRMLVGHVGEWWHSDHTYSGDAANLYIEARPLGCFCERLSESDAVVHLTVTVIRENSLLRLTGGLGPLGLMGVDGNMTLSLVSDTGMTRLAMQYQVGGYSPDGLEEIAPAVDAMLSEQLTRLVRFIESGSPELDDVMLEEGMPMPAEPSLEDAAEDNTTPSELTQPTEQGEAVEPTDTPVVPQDDGDSETPENSS
ncbi:MAG: ATPase [Pseudomonadota bacterium]